ncbi:glutaredoxin [Solidesulfovibrio carbinoliphilus subsp. oakridgensis]|uniref:Glutaredoxin n=1 Tax=Solidesulfovibrio carbinoliphilus subsp. oakridgensis TaxID=694327 RepID=G7Q680_9BACT|nr:glutaredoxin domain-containing protein [Solidesulfovibrio carbinoliphilus]EHJ47253.1 glutaredoxin [Solidesulfovibrio carbinoliphilus subsp. oakridgensis]
MSAKHTLSALTLALAAALVLAAAPLRAAGPTVELFVTSWCPYCSKAKAYFQAKGIAYTAYDIEKDPAAAKRFQQYGQRGVPLVVIGTTAIPGYSVAEYDKALAAAQTAPAHSKTVTAP